MAAITTTDGLTAALQPPYPILKQTLNPVSSAMSSLWTAAGQPGAGAIPAIGGGTALNAATAGAFTLPTLASGQDVYLAAMGLTSVQASTMIIIDRLVATSGKNATLITAQAIATVAIPNRYTNNAGVMMGLEWYAATGATGVTATISYTNSAGVAGKTTSIAVPASANTGRFVMVPLAAGDVGVNSVESVTLNATTGAVGNFGVTLFRSVVTLGVPTSGILQNLDFLQTGLPNLGAFATSQACLSILHLNTGSGTGWLNGVYSAAVA